MSISNMFSIPVKRMVLSAFEGMRHLLWPAVCVNCGLVISENDKGLCKECWGELLNCVGGDYCSRCGRDASKYAMIEGGCAQCHGKDFYFDGIARGGVYNGTLRSMILGLKFRDRAEFSDQLCSMTDSALEGSSFGEQIDMFVPVPLHWFRRLVRGFNQSLIIARGINHVSAKINTDLVRIRYTKRQWSLTPTQRKRNVAGAFAVRKGHSFSGRNVCLVDDITTSNATLNECARTLKEAGAEKVFAVVTAAASQVNS